MPSRYGSPSEARNQLGLARYVQDAEGLKSVIIQGPEPRISARGSNLPSASTGMMLRNQPQASIERMALSGNASLTTMVEASGVVRLVTGRSLLWLLSTLLRFGDSAAKRSKLYLTSSTVIARPLVGGRGSSL